MIVRHKVAVAAAVILAVLAIGWLRSPSRVTRLAFLPVGQGDCALFQTEGRALLVDAGPTGSGARVILPALRRFGVRRIDMILLSHPDADHVGGLSEISAKDPIDHVLIPVYFQSHPDMIKELAEAHIAGPQVTYVGGPADLLAGQFAVHIDVPPYAYGTPDNDGSMMVRISRDQGSVLFTGDAGFLEEFAMMHQGQWASQILKLGHHGSRFSSGDTWLDFVHPQVAIVSCGLNNRDGHPATETLTRCAAHQIAVLRTDQEGALEFGFDQGTFVRR